MMIGDNCNIYTEKIDIGHAFLISMGNNVTISHARLLTHDGSTKKILGYSRVGRIEIGNDVFVGADAIILPGVCIGNGIIIGAGTVVTKDVPSNSIVVGNPARVVGTYDECVKKNHELRNERNTWNTYYSKKSASECKEMQEYLSENRYGFDL